MFSILLHMLFSPWALGGVAALIGLAVLCYFTLGPVVLWKIVSDIRTWFAVAAVLAVLAFAHGEKQNAGLKADIAQATQQITSDKGADKTNNVRIAQKTQRAAQATRLQEAITHADPGTEEDALLDAIAAERPDYHGTEAPYDGVDRAGLAAFDGLRKRPDVAVEP